MRLHVLGLAHIPTSREYYCCAFTMKIIRLIEMLQAKGHWVTFYGCEDSDVPCELVPVLTKEERERDYPPYDWTKKAFDFNSDDEAHKIFHANCIKEINERKQPGDILLITMGWNQREVADQTGLLAIESGVGYEGIYLDKCVFESYAWMHWCYGKYGINNGRNYDAVIPNCYDPDEFFYSDKKSDFALMVSRIIHRKGVQIAIEATKEAGLPLILVGQGSLQEIGMAGHSHVTHIGTLDVLPRSALMSAAKCLFLPTIYIEPFGGVTAEAMFCGTPVITSDWGAFSETVKQGLNGFRCRTLGEYVHAIKNIETIKSSDCRDYAMKNFSTQVGAEMYDAYLKRVSTLFGKGWYELSTPWIGGNYDYS